MGIIAMAEKGSALNPHDIRITGACIQWGEAGTKGHLIRAKCSTRSGEVGVKGKQHNCRTGT
jgi:hypothetical protein